MMLPRGENYFGDYYMQLSQTKTAVQRRKAVSAQIEQLGIDGWRAKRRAAEKTRDGKWKRKGVKSGLCRGAKRRGREKGLPATITVADIHWPEFCPVLGTRLDYDTPRGIRGIVSAPANMPSLDRMDSTRGYVPGNVYVISMRANTLKNCATVDELRKVLGYMEMYGAV
jgi:hypothetical protein